MQSPLKDRDLRLQCIIRLIKMSKSEIVRQYLKENKVKEALRIAKDFRIGVTKEQRSDMARAYECFVHPDFYKSIGKDIENCIKIGKTVLENIIN